jgi:hypothetical protein
MLSKVSQAQRLYVFSYMWKPHLQVKCTYKNIYDYIYIYIYIYSERGQNYISEFHLRGLWEVGELRKCERMKNIEITHLYIIIM